LLEKLHYDIEETDCVTVITITVVEACAAIFVHGNTIYEMAPWLTEKRHYDLEVTDCTIVVEPLLSVAAL